MGCASSAASAQQPQPRTQLHREQLLQAVAPTPTLLSNHGCSVKRVQEKDRDLLRTKFEETCRALLDSSKEDVGTIVSDVLQHANGIIRKGSGLGSSGDCPFASSHEVHLYYQFCLQVLTKWSDYNLGQDEQLDNMFFSQINDLCEILSFLDTDAVPLTEEVEKNIRLIQQEGLFPYWFLGQSRKGEAAARVCLGIGKKWQVEEIGTFEQALASLKLLSDIAPCF
jgi:hypothetical protein